MDIESVMLSQAWWLLAPSTLNRDSRYLGSQGPESTSPFILDYSQLGGTDEITAPAEVRGTNDS